MLEWTHFGGQDARMDTLGWSRCYNGHIWVVKMLEWTHLGGQDARMDTLGWSRC